MNPRSEPERRDRRRVLLCLLPGLALAGFGCARRRDFSCDDTRGLAPDQLEIRAKVAYLERAPKPELACDRCAQYVVAESGDDCGTCKVMPGPTHPDGYCKLFQPTG